MAKQSARSKGYRKVHKEVKGYTPMEKKIMIIGFAAIIVVFLAVVILPDFIESLTLLKVKDGVIQNVEENWLIANVSKTSEKKYRKLAEVNPAEGFELAAVEDGLTDSNLPYFRFEPTGESPVQSYTVQQGSGSAKELCERFGNNISAYGELLSIGEIQEHEINGNKAYSLVAEYRMQDFSQAIAEEEAAKQEALEELAEEILEVTDETPAEETTDETEAPAEETEAPAEETEAPAEEAAEEIVYEYSQSVLLYVESPLAEECVVINALNSGADESAFGDSDAVLEVLLKAAEAVTIEK